MKIFDQQVAPALAVTQQRLDFRQGARFELPALGENRRLSPPRAWMVMPLARLRAGCRNRHIRLFRITTIVPAGLSARR
jgi:hypothetical protein